MSTIDFYQFFRILIYIQHKYIVMKNLEQRLARAHAHYEDARFYLQLMLGELDWPTMTLVDFHRAHTRNSVRISHNGTSIEVQPKASLEDLVYQVLMEREVADCYHAQLPLIRRAFELSTRRKQ